MKLCYCVTAHDICMAFPIYQLYSEEKMLLLVHLNPYYYIVPCYRWMANADPNNQNNMDEYCAVLRYQAADVDGVIDAGCESTSAFICQSTTGKSASQ